MIELFCRILRRKPENTDSIERTALEKFILLANVGQSGQTSVAEFGYGNSIDLTTLHTSAIFREQVRFTFEEEHHSDLYFWWCMGAYDGQKQTILMYRAVSASMNIEDPSLYNHPDLAVQQHTFSLPTMTDNGMYRIGGYKLLDLSQEGLSRAQLSQPDPRTHSTQIDIIEIGSGQKQRQDKRQTNGLVLNPAWV